MTAALTRVVVVHGYGATPSSHWFPWLSTVLARHGVPTDVVELPESSAPVTDAWEDAVASALGTPDAGTWLVTHSLGGVTALRVLEDLPRPWQLGGLVLVAGFTGTLETHPELDAYLEEDVDLAPVSAAVPTRVVVLSDDDPVVPPERSQALAGHLDARVVVVPGKGHFVESEGVRELPVLLDLLPLGTAAG